MKLRYNTLFNLKLDAAYYQEESNRNHLLITPTSSCKKLLSRNKLLSKVDQDGVKVLYETSPDNISPKYPIPLEEKFYFTIKAVHEDFWFYADVKDWKSGSVFILKNPFYNTTADVELLNAALTNTIRSFPMEFGYPVALQNSNGLLEVRDSAGTLLQQKLVRAITPSETVGKPENIELNLIGLHEGIYKIKYINSAGNIDEEIFCSPDYSADLLAIVEMTYKTGGWTGANSKQKYLITIKSKIASWHYDVHIKKNSIPIIPNDLFITHTPVDEPLITINPDLGSIPVEKDFVRFKSTAPIAFSQKPKKLQLKTTVNSTEFVLISSLPMPTKHAIKLDGGGNLFAQIIVNI